MATTIGTRATFTCLVALCILNICLAAPPGRSLWTQDQVQSDARSSEENTDSNAVWEDGDSLDLDDDAPLKISPGFSHSRWIDGNQSPDLEAFDNAEDDNQLDDSDESLESEEEEEELVIEDTGPEMERKEDHEQAKRSDDSKDLFDDALKLRHGGRTRQGDEDEDDEVMADDEPKLQRLDSLPSNDRGDNLEIGNYDLVSFPETDGNDDGSDEEEADDDRNVDDDEDVDGNEVDDDSEDEEDDDDDEDNNVFADDDEKQRQKLFEDRVLLF